MLVNLYTQFPSLTSRRTGCRGAGLTSRFTPSKGWPIRRRRRPIRPYNCPPCLLRRRYRYRSGTGSPRRSPLAGPSAPSSRPPRTACARPSSSSRGTAAEAIVARVARWQGNAGWSCVGTQSRGSSGCRVGTAGHRRRASGWAHHPTAGQVSGVSRNMGKTSEFWGRECFGNLHVPSRSHRCGPSSRRSPHTPCS